MRTGTSRRLKYISLFNQVDDERLALLEAVYHGTIDEITIKKLEDLNEIAEVIVNAIEENGILGG